MDSTEKTAQAEQRAQKKAARRAAFIQDVAEAVYSLGVLRQNEVEAKRQVEELAVSEQRRLQERAEELALAAISPLEALYCKNVSLHSRWKWEAHRISLEDFRAKESLKWLIKNKVLPEGTTHLPDTEGQFQAYATWKVAHPELSRDEPE